MKRVIRLTESDLTRIVKRVIKEQQDPELQHTQDEIKNFNNLFRGKTVNFYLPGDRTLPILPQFYIKETIFSDNIIIIKGTSRVGDVNLFYGCDGTDVFSVNIRKFQNDFLDSVAQDFDLGMNNQWKILLENYIKTKLRTLNKIGVELRRETSKMRNDLYKKYPKPLVEGGADKTGQEMIKYVQDYLCSYNKEGKPVPKATFSSIGTQRNQNLS